MLAVFDRKRGIFSYTLHKENNLKPITSNRLSDPQTDKKISYPSAFFSQNQCHFFLFGRIDNRNELCGLLGIEQREQRTIDNANLLSRLFAIYGENTPTKLYGHWLYIIYDDRKKSLCLAQNHHEYAAIYYYEDKNYFSFSTSQQWLLTLDHVPRQLDLLKIVQRDAVIFPPLADETFFQGIRLLNPAYWMRVTRTESQRTRYWYPENIPINHQISHNEAVEQLLLLFQKAVSKRTHYGTSVASMLSGGLDSGSVVAVAAEQLRKQGRVLHTYSHIPHFDLADLDIGRRTGNERPLMEATASRHSNIATHFIDSADFSLLQGIREINQIFFEPIHAACNAYWIVDLAAQASANGHDVLLTGEMGNATISYTGYPGSLSHRVMLQRFGIKKFVKQHLIKPPYLLAQRSLHLIRWRGNAWQAYSYLHPKLARAIDLEAMIKQSGRHVDFSAMRLTNHQQHMQQILMVGFNPRLRSKFALGHHFGLEIRDPTGDVQLIEFILSLPNEFFFGPKGEPKWMLKQIMRNRLPDEVLYQKSKGLQSADIVKRIQPDIDEIEAIIHDFSSHLHEEPLFDQRRLLNDLHSLRRCEGNHMMAHHLLRTVGIMEFINMVESTDRF